MLALIISIIVIALTAYLLTKKFYPQAILLLAGIVMLFTSLTLGTDYQYVKNSTGSNFFDVFQAIAETLRKNGGGIGMKIMAIGGFVAYMKHIGASNSLVYVAMKPLSIFKKYPYVLASLVIPIGQMLFITIPSATGLGLLLMASVFPLLIRVGVSALSAISVITACTIFDMGPASANTEKASDIIGSDTVSYFIQQQLPVTVPLIICLMILYFFFNRYYDKKDAQKLKESKEEVEELALTAPKIYGVLPILPLGILIVFSEFLNLFEPPILVNTTTAMIVSVLFALMMEFFRYKDKKQVVNSLKVFFTGMGTVFANVVTLIVAASIFAKGLESLGLINNLIEASQSIGLGGVGVTIVMATMIFAASMLMGSGNASFFSFGPLVPNIAAKLGIQAGEMVLPMQLASSMGRATSPIAGVIIATAELGGVSNFDLAKRNLFPLSIGMIILFMLKFLIL